MAELIGAIAKGPFLLGSPLSASIVDSKGNPLGLVFNTKTVDDSGAFNVAIPLGFVSLEGSGFYYNEVLGELSGAPVTLFAFHRITQPGIQQAYINVVTHLGYDRTKQLLEQGASLPNAVDQAETELIAALQLGGMGFDPGAHGIEMDVLGGDTIANAYLLAVGAVLIQVAVLEVGEDGPLDATLQQFINTISLDLQDDGEVSAGVTQLLLDGQTTVDPDQVMAHLVDRLAELGIQTTVPDINEIIDSDLDGLVNNKDNCRFDFNPGQEDEDNDSIGDACDCGNGKVDPSEECDDGNDENTDDCVDGCVAATCGDGFVQAGVEECDDGNMNNNDGCQTDCTGAICGDGIINNGVEDCDDGNILDTDECSNSCVSCNCVLWTETYDGPASKADGAKSVAIDSSGNVLVAGLQTRQAQTETNDAWVRKYDPSGNALWTQTYNSPSDLGASAQGVAADVDGNVVVVGNEYRSDLGENYNSFVRKYDSDGNLLWMTSYNNPSNSVDDAYDVAVDDSGGIYVVGDEWRLDLGESINIWLAKYDPDGNLQWIQTHNGGADGSDVGYGVAIDSLGNVVAAGYEDRDDINQQDNVWLRKYDPSGNEIWTATYDDPGHHDDDARDVAIDANNNVFVAGRVYDPDNNAEGRNVWLAKYDTDGSLLWTRTYNSPANDEDYGNGVAVDLNGDVVVTGPVDRADLNMHINIWLRKYDTNGNEIWTRSYNGPLVEWDWPEEVAIDANGNVVVAGLVNPWPDHDVWVRKYTP